MTSILFDRLVEQEAAARKRAGGAQVRSGPEKGRRLLNIAVAAVGLLVTLPLMLLIAALIKLTSRGPVFFTQTRVGVDRRSPSSPAGNCRRRRNAGGKPFTIYKFRTMRVTDSNPQVWASEDDPRITPVGRFLRSTRLDEIPQLINVLLGDMNVVGPRPEQPEIFAELRTQIPGYANRQQVLPGITGWAQINHHYDTSIDDVRKKLSYDLEYVSLRRSPATDFRIMAKTWPVMVFRKGAL